jgi:predicted GNAT family acetyltransferase
MNDPDVTDRADQHQYELHVDGSLAARMVYVRHGDTITLIHTEVEPEFEGQGLGGRLAAAVLDDARDHGWRVVAQCPFVKSYLDRHPDYTDLTG